MIVGLPGTGMSTLFYLLCVILMPFHTVYLILRGRELRPGHLRLVARQSAISAGLVAMLLVVGLSLTLLLGGVPAPPPGAFVGDWEAVWQAVMRLGTVLAAVTLAVVLVTIRLLAFALRRNRRTVAPLTTQERATGLD